MLSCRAPITTPRALSRPSRRVSCKASGATNPAAWGAALASFSAAAFISIAGPSFARVPEVTTVAPENVGFFTDDEIDARRDQFGVLRAYDGKVALQNKKTRAFWDVKCDLKSPGTLLLREPGEGNVYVLQFGVLKQVDLSDDEVLQAIQTAPWEADLTLVKGPGDDGKPEPLQMVREEFYQLISVTDP